MATTQAILRGKDTTAQGELYSSFELGDKQWKITASHRKRNASRYSVDAGDTAAVADCLWRIRGDVCWGSDVGAGQPPGDCGL